MIMFTFSIRNIPSYESPQGYDAFNDNLLGVNYVQESLSHHPRQVNFRGRGGVQGAGFTSNGPTMRPSKALSRALKKREHLSDRGL